MSREITIVAGPCAVETYEQTMEMAVKIGLVRDAVKPFGISVKYRGGAWKPRTKYYNDRGEKIFEGTREEGLSWLSEAAKKYDLPIVTECMSENDLRHFENHLDPDRDFIQVGARNSQNFALLYAIGGTKFNVLLKNPQHGVDPEEAMGSLQRLAKNKTKIYCFRGVKRPIPIGNGNDVYSKFLSQVQEGSDQDPNARNLNNVADISKLKNHPFFVENKVLFAYDPSHTWGGKNDAIRRKIGEWAIKAITEYRYDWLLLDVYDKSSFAKVDGDQALLTTTKGVDWSLTNAGQGHRIRPGEGKQPDVMPYTLVDIASALIDWQASNDTNLNENDVILAKEKLAEIKQENRQIYLST